MSHLLRGKHKAGDHPQPSPSTSQTSLAGPSQGSSRQHGPQPSKLPTTTTTTTAFPTPIIVPSLRSRESTRATDRTDALWAEMQATLEAVELSAAAATGTSTGTDADPSRSSTSTARVFGPDHERKLDELRAAQIALAQAWARSEADDAIETAAAAASFGVVAGGPAGLAGGGGGGGGAGEGGLMGALSEGRSVGTDGGGAGQERLSGGKLEEETEVDILLARKRREANDRYFQRVNQGVLDVVAKLEDVAIAMRAVEQESKELWGDDIESVPGSAKP
ncbi:hypothetical protein N658DRAFT_477484 [Parathielavia hyrcaniae]|uniref:Uncharacterized protein n=1 Tax=Parathielavia hyrcaniae TaxID=113614 RepID=A0AAN6PW92_9PEZI|nr:hypothetical protein N658DRAFT_477484 [Parathielavia hyrcaniae]